MPGNVSNVSNSSDLKVIKRVGVVGGGQLARMMGEAAHDVDVTITVLSVTGDDAAVPTCDGVVLGTSTDRDALDRLARCVDVITFDHELVNLDQIAELEASGVVMRPSAEALRYSVDKAYQRQALAGAGLPVPHFLVVRSSSDPRLSEFLNEINGPPVIKAARGGYDGHGVLFPGDRAEALVMIDELASATEVVVEERIELLAEVAQLVARGVDGAIALYPLVTTVQSNGMCIEVHFPTEISNELVASASKLGRTIATLIDVVGILAIEFFVSSNGLVVNEVALRPHNSGHWTIEGSTTSQFANHLRAVSGQPLGDVTPTSQCAAMVNVVGADQPGSLESALEIEGVFIHDYGKSWRSGRKLGHVTAIGDDATSVHVAAWKGAYAYGTRTREA